jgi:hypothetical protein
MPGRNIINKTSMMKQILFCLIIYFATHNSYGQVSVLKNYDLEPVEKDSLKSSIIEKSLNGIFGLNLLENRLRKKENNTELKLK